MELKTGFIGCGGIAREYLDRLDRRPETARLAAFCDLDLARAQQLAAGRPDPARCYTDYRAMLERERLDAVFVNLPPFARGEELVEAARRGCHIFTTKPLGLDLAGLDQARRNLAAIEAAGVINSVGYMFRYSGVVDEARRLLEGRPVALAYGSAIGPPPGAGSWYARRESSGGQLVEMSTHIFDALRYFAGDVERVWSLGRSGYSGGRVNYPDASTVALEFVDGGLGNVLSCCAAGQYYWDLALAGPGFHLRLVFDRWTLSGHLDGQTIEHRDEVSGYQEQIDAFLQAVQTGRQGLVRSSYRDGLATFATTLAATAALDSGAAQAVQTYFKR